MTNKKLNPRQEEFLKEIIVEIVSDGASNRGGWQGGFPGSGSPLKGMQGGKNDTGKIPPKKKSVLGGTVNNLDRDSKGNIKLSRQKTQVILEPTIKQSENEINIKNSQLQTPDNPKSPGKPVRQVKEAELSEKDVVAGLVAKGVSHLLKKAFGEKSKPVRKAAQNSLPKVKATAAPKPPTQAKQKKSDLDKSNADFAAWKKKKADMHAVFKAAHDRGLDHDINTPYKSLLQRQQANAAMKAHASNPLKQPSTLEQPAAPTEKPRVRVQAGSRPVEAPKPAIQARMSAKEFSAWQKQNPKVAIKGGGGLAHEENQTQKIIRSHKTGTLRIQTEDGAPTNSMGSSSSTRGTGNIDTYDPLLGKKRKNKLNGPRRIV